MALAKLFKVMDVNGCYWHIAAPSFAEAVNLMEKWESDEPVDGDEEIVQSLEIVEDLILGGTRDESLSNYQLLGFHPLPPTTDWTLANNIAIAATNILNHHAKNLSPDEGTRNLMEALQIAVDKYEELPF